MILTIDKLRELGACEDALEDLRAIFGAGPIEVTEALCVAHAADYNWDWAASRLLGPAALAEFYHASTVAGDEYKRTLDPAWDECCRVRRALTDEFERTKASLRADYTRTLALADIRSREAARAEFELAIDREWAHLNYARARAKANFDRAIAPSQAVFYRAKASAFGKLAEARPESADWRA